MLPENSFTEKHTITRKQMIWTGVAVGVVLLYMNPWIIRGLLSPFTPSRPVVIRQAAPAPVARPVPTVPTVPPPAIGVDLNGKWYGRNLVKDRGTCQLGLEIAPKPGLADHYIGYSSLTCVGLMETHGKIGLTTFKETLRDKFSPSSTILAGEAKDGSVVYRVDKAIESAADKCPLTGMTLTPFGAGVVKAVWTDSCGGGEIALTRSR